VGGTTTVLPPRRRDAAGLDDQIPDRVVLGWGDDANGHFLIQISSV